MTSFYVAVLGATPEWLDRFEGTLSGISVGTVPDESLPTGAVKLDSWARADLALRWQFRSDLELQVRIENLFDSEYQEAVGFEGPGFSARAGLRFRM